MFSYFRFRYRRSLRRFRRTFHSGKKALSSYLARHIWGKWHQVRLVRKFVLLWGGIVLVSFVGLIQQTGALDRASKLPVARAGGIYSEAAIGTVRNLNPILPESAAASDINRLIFSGLTRYNSQRQLIPDLATWDVSNSGKTYTFHLRKGVKWHDGVPFTSADVVFTLNAIQNPDSRSPLASSWEGVKVEAKDAHTVVFTLPQALNSFLDSTTVGIVPRHLLESVEPSLLRDAAFNQKPVGTGPFRIKTFAPSADVVELAANPDYYLGKPQLDGFDFKFYDDADAAIKAFAQRQVTSPGQISSDNYDQARKIGGLVERTLTLPEAETLFFNTNDVLLKDKSLRDILARSLDRGAIVDKAAAGQGTAITQPLLPGQLGYTTKYTPAPLSPAVAAQTLAEAGWIQGSKGAIRIKEGRRLELRLVTLRGGELERAATEIKRQWAALGIDVKVTTVTAEQLQQTYMRPRNFQMLLYGVNLGADSDVYSFWHSTQAADPGINLSAYASPEADRALEAGRINSDPDVRRGKYDTFLKAWNTDTPAAVLYQSVYTYGMRSGVEGLTARRLVVPADRFYGIERWTVRQELEPAQ